MMKNYPPLLRKFMADKAKVTLLVEIILHMKLELYSLKRQEQVSHNFFFQISYLKSLKTKSELVFLSFQYFKDVVQLIKDAFFKHGEKDALRACVKAICYCGIESRGELQDFAQNKLKELADELIAKLKTAMKEAVVHFNHRLSSSFFACVLVDNKKS